MTCRKVYVQPYSLQALGSYTLLQPAALLTADAISPCHFPKKFLKSYLRPCTIIPTSIFWEPKGKWKSKMFQ